MAEARWSYHRFSAWAVIGHEVVDVVGFQVDFELNSIPRASIKLPLGRSVESGLASPIHRIVQDLKEQQPVQLWVNFTPAAASDPGIRTLNIPVGPFKLFEGLTAGGGYVRNNQGVAQYMLTCNHWLVRLNQASAFSQSSHPANPADYSYGAILASAKDTGSLDWTPLTEAHAYMTPGNMAEDMWGAALYPWFLNLASKDGIWVLERGLRGAGSNTQAEAALNRMGPGGRCYVPSKVRGTLSVDVDIATEIANDVSLLTHAPEFVANQTMWDILVGKFCADYLLAVVPRVDDAMVVPYVPGNRGINGKPFETILSDEYVGVQLEAVSRRPLRAYGILSSLVTRSGVEGGVPADNLKGVGGWYDAAKDGAVIIQPGPRWIGAILSPGRYSDSASGGDLRPIGNAMFPGVGTATDADDRARARAADAVKPLLDAYAQARYAQEVLQGRYGVVTGAFRVDIAPGSLVQVEGASETFIADEDAFGLGYFGEVLRVSFIGDAEAATLGTAFHVGFVRTAVENTSDNTSIDGHPLYEETFQGCTLV